MFLDSSSIISGLLFEGNEATLLELGRIKAVKLITNSYVMDEVSRVLKRDAFGLTEQETTGLTRYLNMCITVLDPPSWDDIRDNYDMLIDKKDLPVAVGVIQAKADYLVTGDKELLNHPNLPSITTRKLLELVLPSFS